MRYGKIYTYKDLEEAKTLVGKEVIVSDSLRLITEFPNSCERTELKEISEPSSEEDVYFFMSSDEFYYQFARAIEKNKIYYDDENYVEISDNPTPEEFTEVMDKLLTVCDVPHRHKAMCDLMCFTLECLNYSKGINIFRKEEKSKVCENCKWCYEAHYEEEGEEPYIKRKCINKYGLTKDYGVHKNDFCCRWEMKDK